MAQLGWIGNKKSDGADLKSEIALVENDSGRFESRFSWVKICQGPAMMLQGMQDAVLGVWVSHGEGKFTFWNDSVFDDLVARCQIPIQYVDSEGISTVSYPFNPNGSKAGAAALCSADGRHLAIMPHPERSFLSWQWPYWPPGWPIDAERRSPWIKMFENAFQWCLEKKRFVK